MDSNNHDRNELMLDGIVFYRPVIGMLLEAGAINHPGQIIDEGGPGMTSALTLLCAHNPKEVIESAMKALQLRKNGPEIIASPPVCDHLTPTN